MSSKFRIAILGSKGTTLDLINGLVDTAYRPACVFTLRADHKQRNNIAFFEGEEIRAFCKERDIPVVEVKTYDLSHPDDVETFKQLSLDLLCVIGWERLVPQAVLQSLNVGAMGMHGSPNPLPRGRGRSPMNWSLIKGETKFITNLFRYKAGVDDGDIVESLTFEINPHDDIESLHHKNRAAMLTLLLRHLPKIEAGLTAFTPQPGGEPTYYPKRTADDGGIDWSESTEEIHRLVRAVAPPYPGSFAFLNGERVSISSLQPFDSKMFSDVAPGTIVDISPASNRFVVKTRDGSLLVTKFSGIPIQRLTVGMRLKGVRREELYASLASRYGDDIPERAWEIKPPPLS